MRKWEEGFQFSASDLVGYLNCRHLTLLDRGVAEGTVSKPRVWDDPLLDILWQRGEQHEQDYADHLIRSGVNPIRISGIDITETAVAETLAAMKSGSDVIVQGALSCREWIGRADVLRRVERPSSLGHWSYEAIDTKLARETKAGSILQLCLYTELLSEMQGFTPKYMHVVVPWAHFEPQRYRYADYAAYFRKVKREMLAFVSNDAVADVYPEPIEHCEICRWRQTCDAQRRRDDHPSLVAGISKLQINELRRRGVVTMQKLAEMTLPLQWKPERGSADTYIRIREQARIQVEGRETGQNNYELLPVEAGFGLTCLPEPSPGDIFLDFEGDPFVGEGGLEYLLGYAFTGDDGIAQYSGTWSLTRAEEKKAFEDFVDFICERRKKYPALHIYHYAPYEPSALKRLMGRYATREEEIDQMLRGKLFVDLYQVVRRGLRASVESYSIKKLETFYGFKRATSLDKANIALAQLQASLELEEQPSIHDEIRSAVESYNRDDCMSTLALRTWLELLRTQLINQGQQVERPLPGVGAPNEKISDWLLQINALISELTGDIPADPEERTAEQQACWLLANILDWHRREEKAVWWEYYRLAALSAEDLLEERAGLGSLEFVGTNGGTAKAPVHRYKFGPQETELRGGEELHLVAGDPFGKVEAISIKDRTIEVKKRQDTATVHPEAVFAHTHVSGQVMADALVRIGAYVAAHGISGQGKYQAARDLLLRLAPQVGAGPLTKERETTLGSAVRISGLVAGGVLPIQGPPGAGKTFTASQMICALVGKGRIVGVTANSHKVIRNLIDTVIKAADSKGIDLQCCVKADEIEPPHDRLSFAKSPGELLAALRAGVSVGAGTTWLWSRPDAFETVDVLFVDEAAQMSLANVLAASTAAKAIVLIGDPQQLDQPTKGSHPDGTNVSALDHILNGEHTISAQKGLFLEETWRLHPRICAYTSEVFYDNKLKPRSGLEWQSVKGKGPVIGSGIRFIPVTHHGNQNSSPEEAEAIEAIVESILDGQSTWIDREQHEAPLTLDDILIITPYNAQVFEITSRISGARVGTVDKFQGQEAPIAIYSMATSTYSDAPRGMEFLYSLNRLNVATSRGRCLSLLVCSPQLLEPECRTPRQMLLANAFCRFIELAEKM